jgi:hypothetical protein
MAFRRGAYLRQKMTCRLVAPGRLEIDFAPSEGTFAPWWHSIAIRVHGRDGPATVTSARVPVQSEFDPSSGSLHFELANMPTGGQIVIG